MERSKVHTMINTPVLSPLCVSDRLNPLTSVSIPPAAYYCLIETCPRYVGQQHSSVKILLYESIHRIVQNKSAERQEGIN